MLTLGSPLLHAPVRSVTVLALALTALACADDSLKGLPDPEACPDGSMPVKGQCLGAPGSISGRICDFSTGTWRTDLTVRVEVGDDVLTATTDGDGNFVIDGVPAGTHYVDLAGNGYAEELVAKVKEGEVTQLGATDCTPPPGHIKGRVCNESLGVWVNAALVSLSTVPATSTVTDAFGNYVFLSVPAGDYTLTVTSPSYNGTRTATVRTGQTTDLGPATCVGSTGGVQGRICGPSGLWLSGARVYVDLGGGNVVETSTDAAGNYTLTGVPDGTHTVHVTRGSFETSFTATVVTGQITAIPDPVCLPPTARIAVVTGIYDKVEQVLGGLGYGVRARYDSVTPTIVDASKTIDIIRGADSSFWLEEFLADALWLDDYDIVFLNCGVNDGAISSGASYVAGATENLRKFVENGGSVYASDWASELARLAFAGRINFYGNDANFGEARVGGIAASQAAYVVDPGLAMALGRTDLVINLNLSNWVLMDTRSGQPSDLRVLVQANVRRCSNPGFCFTGDADFQSAPLVVRFNYGAGRVLFTSAHNEAQTSQDLRDVLNYIVFEL